MNGIDGPAEVSAVGTIARPMRKDALRNQEAVLTAAREVISESGVEASMEQIATRAGVGVGTLYRHYPNKQALVDELVRIILDELISTARAGLEDELGHGLETFLRAFGRSLARHHGYSAQLFSPGNEEHQQQLNALIGQLHSQAGQHGRISPGVALGDVRALMWALRGIVAVTGRNAPDAWQRHLDLHLAALRADPLPSSRPAVSDDQLLRIAAAQRDRRPPR
ncbi:TetR/AcrR family transcriptional regulator [Kineosporia sp. J2-2]|uniref:TetR/AcrR family transcriptional regulator n=1 Tax=Kineosporia corallincola TaxID=2835133 RepID=A0ABS5T935_9ACTN|nr:TetR/AcrR family transcriptional regulator [Kineosporia corallincola]MBT0767552.1 TetR/AcrR family transcriptional regulator [Kineosporia corallincola]